MDIEELLRQLQLNLDEGPLTQLYRLSSVTVEEVLSDMRLAGVEVYSLEDISRVPTALLDPVADSYIRASRRAGAISGASFGLGGLLSVAPELVYLMSSVLRLSQRLSLVYGLEFTTPRGSLDLWTTLGSALGVKVQFDGLEHDLFRNLPMVIGRGPFRDPLILRLAQKIALAIAVKLSTRFSRFIPLLGVGVGGLTSYAWFAWLGGRLKEAFRARHQLRFLDLGGAGTSEEIAFSLENQRG